MSCAWWCFATWCFLVPPAAWFATHMPESWERHHQAHRYASGWLNVGLLFLLVFILGGALDIEARSPAAERRPARTSA